MGKHLNFYSKDVCSFSLFFDLNEEELIQQVCLRKYKENEFFNSTLYKTQYKRKGAKT